MESLDSPQKAYEWCNQARMDGNRIGFVPTMGALHNGHYSLISNSLQENDVCIVSIFVNPLQFNNASDLETYPDTFENDLLALEKMGCDMVFTGSLEQFFPDAKDLSNIPKLSPGQAALGLEGTFRPGHLEGVVTIVDRLFRVSGSCSAYFGEKDFQQTLVVKDLARSLISDEILVDINICETIREANGLAMSSRNQRLGKDDKRLAGKIYEALDLTKRRWQQGVRSAAALETLMTETLNHPKLKLEYAAVRDEANWTSYTPTVPLSKPRALIAVYLNQVRLIDNLSLI